VDAFDGTRARGTLTLKRACITLVLPRFLTLQDAEAKADEFSVAAAEVSNLTIAAEPAGLTIDVAVTVAVAFPDDMAFKVLLAERVAVITYVDDLVQLPIGSLTIGAVELTPGEVTPLTTAFHLHLRQDTFWGAGPASAVFFRGGGRSETTDRAPRVRPERADAGQFVATKVLTTPSRIRLGPTRVDMEARTEPCGIRPLV